MHFFRGYLTIKEYARQVEGKSERAIYFDIQLGRGPDILKVGAASFVVIASLPADKHAKAVAYQNRLETLCEEALAHRAAGRPAPVYACSMLPSETA